jgi:hypothetical protein
MSSFSATVLFLGLALEVCLGCILVRKQLWRTYPFLSVFVCCFIARTLLLFVFPPNRHPVFYWASDALDVLLRFLVVCEVFRQIFPKGRAISIFYSKGLIMIITTLLMLLVGMFWSYQAYSNSRSIGTALERSSSFLQATMTLGLLLASRYYGLRLGQQLHSIAIAFGAWASIATVNNALFDLEHSFLPYWQILRPLSFVVLIGAWTWALWIEAPEARGVDASYVTEFNIWNEKWNRMRVSLRRITSR